MKVGIVSSSVPFIDGGYRNIVTWLTSQLVRAGHEVEEIYIPFDDDPRNLFPQLAAFRMIDLTDRADVIVCFRPPSHLVRHPRKVVWFIHHIRIFYDLWDTPYRPFEDTAATRATRAALMDVDRAALSEASKIFTISRTITNRIAQFNDLDSTVLYPPLHDPERYANLSTGDEIVYVSRLEEHKRQHLLIEAMRHTKSGARVRILGTSGGSEYGARLRELANERGVSDRLVLEDAWITEELKERRVGEALAVAYLPVDEDAYGYPTLEGAAASKAILTTTDAGGTTEFVRDGIEGFVVAPEPAALAEAIDRLYIERDATIRMGVASNARVAELGITWDAVLEGLLS
jgi:glycosyltransferase involved in cell wall biosynthesis